MSNSNTIEFAVTPESEGLTSEEAAARLRKIGPNTISKMAPLGARTFLLKFWGVIPWMLELAIFFDLLMKRWLEAIMIGALLVFNALIGFFQERKAKQAIALLYQHLSVMARVKRDSQWQRLPAAKLVPGDLVHLRVGDIVPADIQLLENHIAVDQSALTGESLPVDQDPGSTAFAGSFVSRGEATGWVTATGRRTYYGKTAELVRLAEAPKRLELLIIRIAKALAAMVIVLAVIVFAATLIRGDPLIDMLPFGLMLLVVSVPVALPMMFAMSAALGSRSLAEKGVLVSRLSAIQDAAVMDILCLDKTGTITENRITVERVVEVNGATPDEILRLAAFASDDATQDPIDLAILQAARAKGLLTNPPKPISFIPFDLATKCSEVSIQQGEGVLRIVKGAPQAVVKLTSVPWGEISKEVNRLSEDGSRVLAVATGDGKELRIVGLLALGDPPRSDSRALIGDLENRGLHVLLVTGDGEATARAIASRVGIKGKVAPAGSLHENLSPEDIRGYQVFPGVFPEDKFFLVQTLQKAGHVVGMTGDGVNDAPALRQADVGIAVANATDVAKSAASLVLTHPGLGAIIEAIDGSRRIYQRILTFAQTMISMKLSVPPFLALGLLLFGVFMVQPIMIVLLFFCTDIVMTTISTDRVIPSPTPNRWDVRTLMTIGSGLAVLHFSMAGAAYWTGTYALHLSPGATQTLVFVWLVFGVQAIIYVNRAPGFFWSSPPSPLVLLASLFDIALVTLLATRGWLIARIPLALVGAALMAAMVVLLVVSLLKVSFVHRTAIHGETSEGTAIP